MSYAAMRVVILFCCVLIGVLPLGAADFPPITDAERALNEVPGQPGSPAVVLFKKGELKLQDYPTEVSSYMKVKVRLKILTEDGKDFGEVEIPHSGYYRLKEVEGRTVLPDGKKYELAKDSVFEERRSRSLKRFVTKLVFPAVEVGAIIDYSYTVRWDDIFFLEPWYFHNRVPTLLSEIIYIKPGSLALQPWGVQAPGLPIQSEVRNTSKGKATRLWAENLPGIPDEPYGFSFNDLSNRSMMIPVAVVASGTRVPLMGSWEETCELYAPAYRAARKKERLARKKATELAAGQTSLLDKIAALHGFVRDEIQNQATVSVGLGGEDVKVDDVLEERRGTPVAKALLLQSMLSAIKVDSDLIWVADRTIGRPDLRVANPWWFDAGLVRVEVDKAPLFLDPVDRSVGFGRLAPYHEGTQGVLFHKTKPQIVQLPASSNEHNLRRVKVDLELDDEGRLIGQGSQELEGHQAWRFLRWKDDPESTSDAWRERLEKRFSGFDVSDVEVEEDIRQQTVRVGWSMRQRDEEVLGDEATILPSQPLTAIQPFSLTAEQRRTPVQMSFSWRDDLVTTIKWPAGWTLDVLPEDMSHGGPAGKFECDVERGEGGGSVTVRRRFEVAQNEFVGREGYLALQNLYQEASKADAQGVVLVRD